MPSLSTFILGDGMQVVFEFTRDPDLLQQYYALRQHCYRKELKLDDFDGSEEPADLEGHIFIARYQRQCLGGARVISSHLDASHGTSLQGLLPELGLSEQPFCFWERLSLSQTLRAHQLQKEFCAHLVNASFDLGYRYAFMVSSVRNARFYRLCHSMLEITYQIFNQIKCTPQGVFSQLEHVLSAAHLSYIDQETLSWVQQLREQAYKNACSEAA